MGNRRRVDELENALAAMGCPDARSVAVLTMEIFGEGDTTMVAALPGARLTEVRGERYGPPGENFERIAHLWEPILGVRVTAQQVGLAMIAVKLARLIQTPDDPDSIRDLSGYAATLDLLAGRPASV